ncbi:MAG: enoyl-CoA hydratase/isomerase family protein [Proteobacteria bacterium]|jgi:enoyl-CoA hydratase|nr:enoyl-CoA hydratase/isomerase family protein [Pseudomonadota bacterium]
MKYETILYEKRGEVAIVRLNRPERMNAVVERMYLDLTDALSVAEVDAGLRAVILTGSVRVRDGVEKQAFCAGADLKKHDSGDRSHADKRAYIMLAHETARLLYDFPKPVIAAVNGPARGAGAEMALCADFILMADSATIAFTETGLGTFVGGGSTRHLPRLVGPARAKELIYTGRVVFGPEAVAMGLALESCPVDRLMGRAMDLAGVVASKAPLSIRLAKKRLQQPAALDLDSVLHLEAEAILSCMDTEDWREGIRSFAERREPRFTGK